MSVKTLLLTFLVALASSATALVAVAQQTGGFRTQISLPGVIQPSETMRVQPTAGGRVIAIEVDENDRVQKGDVLLTIKNDSIRNNVRDLETSLKDVERRLRDEETLFNQGTSTRSQLDAIKLQYDRSTIALENARIGLEETFLKTTISGIVNRRNVEVGEVVGSGSVLFEIINIDEVEVVVEVEEEDIPNLKIGQQVVFTTPSAPGETFTGTLDSISWASNAQSGRFPVYLKAGNTDLKLRAGMSAKVYLIQ